jgi:hypothetical protein
MGLILDSSVAIDAERKGLPAEAMLARIRELAGSVEIAPSVVSVMELEQWRLASHRPEQSKPPQELCR